jgi:hypothetical protein
MHQRISSKAQRNRQSRGFSPVRASQGFEPQGSLLESDPMSDVLDRDIKLINVLARKFMLPSHIRMWWSTHEN